MRRYLPFAIIGAVILFGVGGGLVLFRSKQSTSAPIAPIPPVVPTAPANAPVAPEEAPAKRETESLHVRGGANARVTVEEFFPTLTKVEEDYGDRLRVVFRHKPLHKHELAVVAAHAAEAAGLQGHFWEMHDLLFQNSLRWTKGVDTVGPDPAPSQRLQSKVLAMEIEVRDVFVSYAERLKLDVERFKTDMDSDEVKARVESDRAHGDTLGIDRTPTVYINGHLVPNLSIHTVEGLHAAIDAELNGHAQQTAALRTPSATPEQSK